MFYLFLKFLDQFHSKLDRLFHVLQSLKILQVFYFFYMIVVKNKTLNLGIGLQHVDIV